MKIVSFIEENSERAIVLLQQSIVRDTCWLNVNGGIGINRTADTATLERVLNDSAKSGVFYVGTDDWTGKTFVVTLVPGASWAQAKPAVYAAFESLPHVPWS